MMPLLLEDSLSKPLLFPFTFTRSSAELRIGILTIKEKWETLLSTPVQLCEEVDALFQSSDDKKGLRVMAANIIPTKNNIEAWLTGKLNLENCMHAEEARVLRRPWQIMLYNDWALRADYELITTGKTSAPLPASVQAINPANIFIEETAVLQHCILNASTGPIYIGKNTEIMEGSCIRGPFALCEGSVVKMGSKIYGATTIGPHCIVGGEIKNSVLFGYSNKAHEGYLGDSVVAEWCNLGAGTSTSNLKNTASTVKVFNYNTETMEAAGTKCGLLMADYSRAAINTSFNTGTVVGVCCNIIQSGLTPKYIPHFSWGNEIYQLEKAIKDIANWKQLKKQLLTEKEIQTLAHIFEESRR
jgi:UDP-N-acetylglucosamine diphosphorylase / glucose-1-phosphate thymidylyltransferase / UDP-N-acetylgalactosamine diphosphorylase / glucosamine-1-phosphate N-acetyltransferase / galactosamine-1-phosphate N-acetyltransferase